MAESILWKYFKKKTYQQLLKECLDRIPDELDKREGSIIWDALAPACWEMSNIYDDLYTLLEQTYGLTASKPYLDLRCAERGVFRLQALAAYRKIYFSKETSEGVLEPVKNIRIRTESTPGLMLTTTNLDSNFNFEIISKYTTPSVKQASIKYEISEDVWVSATATKNYLGSAGNNLSFSISAEDAKLILRTYKNDTIIFEEEVSGTFDILPSNTALKFEGEGSITEVPQKTLLGGEDKGTEKDGYYIGEASITGEAGNSYQGKIIPLENLGDAEATLLDVTTYGRDEESDDSLRERYFDFLKKESFGGNIAQYKEWLLNVDDTTEAPPGIKGVQVYPVWNGGGTVKISFIMDEEYEVPSEEAIQEVKEFLDPETFTQEGIGISPIGHNVTVVAPTETKVHFKIPISFAEGTLASYTAIIKDALESHLLELRKSWDNLDATKNQYIVNVIHAEIVSIVMKIEGILDVKDTELLMSKDETTWTNLNLSLTQTKDLQELPFLGTVEVTKI